MLVSFELVSPERLLLSEDVEMVVVPGTEGDFGVLEGHAPLISGLRAGVIATYRNGDVVKRIFVAGGFAEVTVGRCTVLAEEAHPIEEISRAEAEERVLAARSLVDDPGQNPSNAREKLATAEALLAAVEGR